MSALYHKLIPIASDYTGVLNAMSAIELSEFYLPEGVLSIIDRKTNPLSKVPYASPIFANAIANELCGTGCHQTA